MRSSRLTRASAINRPPGSDVAILVLPTTSWPRIQAHLEQIAAAVDALNPGDYLELRFAQDTDVPGNNSTATLPRYSPHPPSSHPPSSSAPAPAPRTPAPRPPASPPGRADCRSYNP